MNAVEVYDITKIYNGGFRKPKVAALKNLSLTVPEGTIFGLLGPNGAGKTTLIKILLGITYQTSGEAKILGQSVTDYKIKHRIGYLPENHKFPPYLTGEQLLKFAAKLTNTQEKNLNKRIDALLSLVKMSKWKKTKIKKYSKGMMQRIGLAQAMINNPDLIFLDEPTDGVDPIGRKEIRDILIDLKSQGKTIFLNSHLLSEVELVTDRVAILNKGTLIQEGTVEELTTAKEIYKITLEYKLSEEHLKKFSEYSIKYEENNSYVVKVTELAKLNSLIDEIRRNNINIKSIVPLRKSLEDMFISLIKETEKER
ncbi:ATP-binding cassette domain-containing protein [Melioribacteraceae bacterium 4301-Me]|uniref:ABC transporter ATP-binding protein n=1 Tax=Pyranulibacter aquaticus TaxID=3163344 RepID=UPI00359B82F0